MIAFINESCFDDIMKILSEQKIVEVKGQLQDINIFTLYNLSSAINRGIRLSSLIPPVAVDNVMTNIDFGDEKTFDMMYAQYLMNHAFVDMFSIVNNLYNGGSSLIIVGNTEYKIMITESLIKFLQQRYGLSPIRVINEVEDWYSYNDESDFNLTGIFNLDVDKEKFVMETTDFSKLNIEEGE